MQVTANEIAAISHLTTETLEERLTKLEEMGKRTAAKIEAGDLGEIEGEHIRKGQLQPTYRNVAAMNRLRRCYAVTLAALNQRRA